MNVLMVGAAGLVGRRLTEELEKYHTVRLADIVPIPGDDRAMIVDIRDLNQVLPAMEGMDAVVHTAIASTRHGETPEEFDSERFDINVKGTYHVLEAAHRCGVSRAVCTSSLMAVHGHGKEKYIGPDTPENPLTVYGLTKYLNERICQFYGENYDMSVICLRIAGPTDPDAPGPKERGVGAQSPAFPDLVRAYKLALEVPHQGYDLIQIVGETSRRRWDLSKAERILGYRPEYNFEKMGYPIRG